MDQKEIKAITDTCFLSHKNELEDQNNAHLKSMKRVILTRVTLPVTVLLALGLFVLRTIFAVGMDAATHQATTTGELKAVIQKVDVMGSIMMDEAKLRAEGDNAVKTDYRELEKKMDDNFKYLYQNSMFKTRGGSLPYVANNKSK